MSSSATAETAVAAMLTTASTSLSLAETLMAAPMHPHNLLVFSPDPAASGKEEDADAGAASALALLMWMATQEEAKAARVSALAACALIGAVATAARASTTHINAVAATMMLGAIEFASVGSTATAAAAQGVSLDRNAFASRDTPVDTAVVHRGPVASSDRTAAITEPRRASDAMIVSPTDDAATAASDAAAAAAAALRGIRNLANFCSARCAAAFADNEGESPRCASAAAATTTPSSPPDPFLEEAVAAATTISNS